MLKTSEVYKHLYHYTNWQGLLGILESQSLWATHFQFLNDCSEIKLFMEEKFLDIFYPYMLEKYKDTLEKNSHIKENFQQSGNSLEDITKFDTALLRDTLFNLLDEQIYITSFCGEDKDEYIRQNGILSQWRGYGQNGGFAIVFDTASIENCMDVEGKKFAYGFGTTADIVYSHEQERFKNEFSESIAEIVKFFNTLADHTAFGDAGAPDEIQNPYTPFLNCITRYKHRGFREENEVRIVLHLLSRKEYLEHEERLSKPIEFRSRNGEQVPYIKLLGNENDKEFRLPIKKIIVGPHKEKESRAAFLRTKLIGTDIEVSVSDIPYVT
jgi:hypothetical protein